MQAHTMPTSISIVLQYPNGALSHVKLVLFENLKSVSSRMTLTMVTLFLISLLI